MHCTSHIVSQTLRCPRRRNSWGERFYFFRRVLIHDWTLTHLRKFGHPAYCLPNYVRMVTDTDNATGSTPGDATGGADTGDDGAEEHVYMLL